MSSRLPRQSIRSRLRPYVLTTLGATVAGATALYFSIRPRNIPGSDPQLVPPPKYGEEGRLDPPTFPASRDRKSQIASLMKSAGKGGNTGVRDSVSQGWARWAGFGSKEDETETKEFVRYEEEEYQPYDLLIIGGGATGSGIALDAATRGLRVAMVERDDFASGTSSKSTKLVHGGVRYLEKAVFELDYSQYVILLSLLLLSCSRSTLVRFAKEHQLTHVQ